MPDDDAPETSDLLQSMDSTATYVAFLTGVKQQFLDSGWTIPNAERAALDMMQQVKGIQHQ